MPHFEPATALSQSDPRADRPYHLAAGALIVVGLVLRLIALGDGLWYDEIRTLVEYARRPLGTVLSTYDNQNQHLLYSVLARISFALLGESPAALRVPAVLLGVGSLCACYRFARLVADRREALLATAFLTVSYHHVWFSQNARGYTGLLLFFLVGTGALYRLLSDRTASARQVWVYAIAMALGAYTHVTAVLVSLTHAVVVAARWWRSGSMANVRRPIQGLVLSGLLGLVLYAPVLTQLAGTLTGPNPDSAATAWRNPLWLFAEAARGLARGLPGGWVVVGLGGVVATVGLVGFARASLTLTTLMVAPALVIAAATITLGHNIWPRFFFFSMGSAVLIAIRGVFTLARAAFPARGAALATSLLAIGIAASAATVPRAWAPKQDFGEAARFVDGRRGARDGVATVDLTADPYQNYFRRPWTEVRGLAQLEVMERDHDRTWVLFTFPIRLAEVEPEIWARLMARYDTAAVYRGTVGGGDVVVMVSKPDRAGQRREP